MCVFSRQRSDFVLPKEIFFHKYVNKPHTQLDRLKKYFVVKKNFLTTRPIDINKFVLINWFGQYSTKGQNSNRCLW